MNISTRALNRISIVGAVALLVLMGAAILFSNTGRAQAQPQSFCRDTFASASTTLAATSTLNLKYLSPGAGTTTLTTTNCYDRAYALNNLTLAIQDTASSTATLAFRIEGSWDGIDWYSLGKTLLVSGSDATSTPITGNFSNYQMTIATSTADTGASGSLAQVNTSVELPIFMPYERVVFYVPTGGGNHSIYPELIGRREISGR